MTTGVLATPPILQFTLNNGQPAVNCSILTQVGGVNAATYSDSGLTTPLPNPIPLNSRGEVSDASGASKQLFLTPNIVYTFTLSDAGGNQIWQASYVNGVQLTGPATAAALNTVTSVPILASYAQTAAEIAAGVTPTNYAYPEVVGLAGAQRFGADITGAADATTALQNWANGCGGVMIFPPNATFLVSAQISIPAGTIIYGNGSTLNAASTWSSISGWHMLNAKGSLSAQNLNFTVPAVARNTSWKAITCDNSVQALAANTRLIVRECIVSNLDIGVYTDGGASARIAYAEVSRCIITINTLGTGGGSSVRPTVNLNQCGEVVIRDNPLLDASDRTNSVNNIYCIGSAKLTVDNNYLVSGTVKCLSNANFSVTDFTLQNNRLQSIPWVQCQVDTNPIKLVKILGNYFDGPITQAVDVACVIFTNLTNCATDSYQSIICMGNYFGNVPYSVYYIAPSATNSVGSVQLSNNRYDSTSTGSVGNFAVVNFTTSGANYRSLVCANESVNGHTNTRSYLQAAAYGGANPFTDVLLTNIEESNITGAKTGSVIKTCTLTLGGVTGTVTCTATYSIRDGIASISVPSVSGTSNSTSCGLTGLPAELEPASQSAQIPILASDNGALVGAAASGVTSAQINAASSTITLLKNGSSTGWTNASTKGPLNFSITYPLG